MLLEPISLIAEILSKSISKTLDVSESKDLEIIDNETKKQTLELQMAHAQAKVAQEIAIAQRIENASEVVIEEYYSGEVKGNVGVTGDENGLTLGASGEGRKITKRIYRFIGGNTSNLNHVEIKIPKEIDSEV